MPDNDQADPQRSVGTLVGGILEDVQNLLRQEMALARREFAEAWDRTKAASTLLGGALAAFGLGGIFLGFMLVKLLQNFLLPDQEWVCFGIVAGSFALLGVALFYGVGTQINRIHLAPQQTLETIREDAQAVSDAVSGSRPAAGTILKR